jgi:hypothetical protein
MEKLPPLPPVTSKNRIYSIAAAISFVILVVFIGGVLLIRSILVSGITAGPDNMFGDQNLKTAVALIELHKVRYGKYPESLSNLKFTGQWDQLALNSVSYYPNKDHTAYYIEVERGWVGKPTLNMPKEFWKGTGYDPALKPKDE